MSEKRQIAWEQTNKQADAWEYLQDHQTREIFDGVDLVIISKEKFLFEPIDDTRFGQQESFTADGLLFAAKPWVFLEGRFGKPYSKF